MTYGRMKQFRRDRVFASDRERLQFLTEHLRKGRVMDDQNVFNIGGFSPNRGQKGNDGGRGGSPSKISPTKTTGGNGPKFNEAHTNNGQVMTQISAIYAKRSRSILNEFGQTNAGGKHHPNNHASQQPAYSNAASNANSHSNHNQNRGNLNSNQNQHSNADS